MNNLFKLSAIASTAVVLTACGGGGGGGSSIANTPTDPRVYVTSSDYVKSNLPDVAQAHRDGWSGQATSILSTASSDALVKQIAPSAEYGSNQGITFNWYYPVGAGNPVVDPTSHGGILTTERENPNFISDLKANRIGNQTQAALTGIAVKNDTVTAGTAKLDITISSPTSFTYRLTPLTKDQEATFSSIANAPSITTQADRSAYLLGSAAIIQSKFATTSVDVVKIMDQNRDGTGAFSLSRSLAAKSVR